MQNLMIYLLMISGQDELASRSNPVNLRTIADPAALQTMIPNTRLDL